MTAPGHRLIATPQTPDKEKRMASIRERLMLNAQSWRPEEGDILAGEVLDISSREGYDEKQGRYNVYTIRDDETGEVAAFHAMTSVARSKVQELRPEIGDQMGVRYLGKVKGKGSSSYHSFTIVVEKANRPAVHDDGDTGFDDGGFDPDNPFGPEGDELFS